MSVGKIGRVILGFAWFFVATALLIYSWTWFTTIGEYIIDSTFNIIYWTGAILMVLVCGYLPPYLLVINAFKNEE